MRTLLLVAMVTAFGLQQADGAQWDFRKMVTNATGEEAASSYGAYGCHCGVGGRGSPKNSTERCCSRHECCYARLRRRGCLPRYQKYNFNYRGNRIICGRQTFCERQVCECDKAAALCFGRNKKSYKKLYQCYKKTSCRGKTGRC